MSLISLQEPFTAENIKKLSCGDFVEISGVIYTARDAAHARLIEALAQGDDLPITLKDQIIYYAGPAPSRPGQVIGSCGPTTAGRMDSFTPALIEAGIRGMIGKGPRSTEVVDVMKQFGAVYFAAVGDAAALTSKCIVEADVLAYEDLGPEAIRRLVVKNYPCLVAIDAQGRCIYDEGPRAFKK